MNKSKEHVTILAICFVCFIIFAIFAIVAIAGGFKFLDESTVDPTSTPKQCCTECVESFGKFVGFVFFVPLAIFVVCMSISLYIFGIENIKKAGGDIYGSAKSRAGAATKSAKELKASEYLFALGFFVFALVAVILTFTSGKGLYSTLDYKNNNPTTTCPQGKWCTACKPEFWRLFLASAGAGFGVWIIATGLLIASKMHQKQQQQLIGGGGPAALIGGNYYL